MTKKEIINDDHMKCWLASIYVNWDEEDDGYHDIMAYGIKQASIGQCLSWLVLEEVDDNVEWMNKIFDYVIHDVADNYEFDEDAVGNDGYWKQAASDWRK